MANDKTYDRHINIWINGKEVKNDVASIKKEMFNLTNEVARATLGTKEYNEKAAELKKVKAILKEHQENIAAAGSSWDNIKKSFSSAQGLFLVGLGGITAAYQTLKTVIFSTDSLGDKFEKTLGGWKGGIDAVARAIATLDFKNFGKNIKTAIEEGRRYAEQLDQIDENTRALKIAEAEAANELLKQREIQNDVRKSLTERNAAGKKAIQIEEDLAEIRTKIGKQGFDNESKNIASITHLTEAEVLAYAKQEKQMVANIETGKLYNDAKSKLAKYYGGALALTEEEFKIYNDSVKNASDETIRFAFAAANMPGDDKMQIFVDKYVGYMQAIGSALDNTLKIRSKQAKTEVALLDEQIENMTKVVATGIKNPTYNADEYIKAQSDKIIAAEKEKNADSLKDYEETQQKKTEALIKAGEQGKEEALRTWNEIKTNDRKALEDMAQEYVDFGARVGDAVGQAIADGTMDAKEAAKQLVMVALDELGNYATIAIAKATIGSLTTADSIMTFGATGAIRAAVLTGLIRAAVAATKGIIAKSMYTGGYAEPGGKYEPAGIFHKGEYIVNADMVASPVTGPIVQALEAYRLGGMPGYANGGGQGVTPSGSGSGSSAAALPLAGSDPELKALIRENLRVNKMLLTHGVKTHWTYKDVDNVREGISRLEDNESNVTR